MAIRGCLLLLVSVLAACSRTTAQTPLVVGAVTAAPGTMVSGSFEVPPRGGDAGATIPFTVIRGTAAGPVLALVAGTHGAEYVPIIALQRVLRRRSTPKSLRGTVLIVHVANMPSFLGRTVYYSPADGKNLNRVFPGKADGTLSERIADVITREIIGRATHVVDLHCGDGNESLRPYSYWITTGDPQSGRGRAKPWRSRSASIGSSSTARGRPTRRRHSICPTPRSRAANRRSRPKPAASAWWMTTR